MTDIVPLEPSGSALDHAAIVARYAPIVRGRTTVRVNFIASVDGSATVSGLSGGLGGDADKAVFDTLRGLSDVVLAAAGTVRKEGYGALVTPDPMREWRDAAGLPAHPVMAVVSGSLDLDPADDLFTKAPERPIVYTVATSPQEARDRLAEVADLVVAGEERVEPGRVVADLAERGLHQILCEGGPSLFGAFIDAGAVDELCLTVSPLLEGGAGPRIARGSASPTSLRLEHVLAAGSVLLTRWVRA
ncbi:pyrimidine reductase family protein [Cnuibacter sp. UC19_7]|uniref:pyrimidine reductase family protein n=1 Tax=Cnuibacter sp. UC19_7 TaxID=3350166 RepID=UPI00366C028C